MPDIKSKSNIKIVKQNDGSEAVILRLLNGEEKALLKLDGSYCEVKVFSNGDNNWVLYILYYLRVIGCYQFICYDINCAFGICGEKNMMLYDQPLMIVDRTFFCDCYPKREICLVNIPGSSLYKFEQEVREKFEVFENITFEFNIIDRKASRMLYYFVIRFDDEVRVHIGLMIDPSLNDGFGIFNTVFTDSGDVLVSNEDSPNKFVSKDTFFSSINVKRLFLSLTSEYLNGKKGCSFDERELERQHRQILGR